MIVRKGAKSIRLAEAPAVIDSIFSIEAGLHFLLMAISMDDLVELRAKHPKISGLPSYYANDGDTIYMHPMNDKRREFRIRYLVRREE